MQPGRHLRRRNLHAAHGEPEFDATDEAELELAIPFFFFFSVQLQLINYVLLHSTF